MSEAPPTIPAPGAARALTPVVAGLWLGAPIGILLAASWLEVGEHRQVLLPWLAVALPETCAMHTRFGIDCPGCGLTRGFIHLAHARPWEAWRLNPLSWLIFAYVAQQIPLVTLHIARVRPPWVLRWTRLNEWMLIVLMVGLVLQWIVRWFLGQLG